MDKTVAERIGAELTTLKQFSADTTGVTRLPFTKEAAAAVSYLAGCMRAAGLLVSIDMTGAVHGLLPGRSARRIVLGSHYDSVRCGGAFDGAAGVVCGIEIARQFRPRELYYTLEVIALNDEEGVRFGGGFLSSKALLGEWSVEQLKLARDKDGICIYDAMTLAGFAPETLPTAAWQLQDIRCFLEIHIEQGAVMEQSNCELGIVNAIVGMRRYQVRFQGRADHVGTTPMHLRHDALAASAELVLAAETAARRHSGAVATVGACTVEPNMVNTVPATVVLSLDVRSRQLADILAIETELRAVLQTAAANRGVAYSLQPILSADPVNMDAALQAVLSAGAVAGGYRFMELSSGAGHDALPMARKIPTAKVFVPSRGGRSHCPEEYSAVEDLAKAVDIVLYTIKKMNGEENNELSQ